MANRALLHLILSSRPKYKPCLPSLYKKLHTQIPTKEIRIPVKYGHLAGKLWGNSDKKPILALHGWQDNAGTWDTLIPMIIKDRPILALDFPGHGLSSWIQGVMYYEWEWPKVIFYVKEYLKLDKMSLLSHSMGAIASMRFASLFPDSVDFYIALDSFIYDTYDPNLVVNYFTKFIPKDVFTESFLDTEPPTYTLEEMAKIWHTGTRKSVALNSAQHLLKRGAKQSKTDRNKYFFSRDPKLKYMLYNPEQEKFIETLVKRIKSPMLYIKAMDSKFSTTALCVEMREQLQKLNGKYEFHLVPGTHHVHLNNPEKIAPLISNFIEKHNLSL